MSPVAASEESVPTEAKGVSAKGMLATNPSTRVEVLSGHGGGGESGRRTLTVTGGGTRDKLRRVLRAFAVYNRRVSYCQVRRCAAAFDLSQGCLICPTFALTTVFCVQYKVPQREIRRVGNSAAGDEGDRCERSLCLSSCNTFGKFAVSLPVLG